MNTSDLYEYKYTYNIWIHIIYKTILTGEIQQYYMNTYKKYEYSCYLVLKTNQSQISRASTAIAILNALHCF